MKIYQIVENIPTPVTKKQSALNKQAQAALLKSKTSKDPNMFEADEFMKGPGEGIGDYEGGGAYDDLKFGVESWANLVKAPEQKLDEAAKKFRETQTNPNPNVSGKDPGTGEEFAKGGRVGYNMGGGIQTLFRRKAS